MPHKDRGQRLAYLRRWKETGRPSPSAEPQADPSLPPRGRIVFSAGGDKVQCHACGRWLGSLNTHVRMHGLDAATYKETYGLARTASLWPPALKDKQRSAAIERGQGDIGRAHLPSHPGRPTGLINRLAVRIEASESRKGLNPRGHARARRKDTP